MMNGRLALVTILGGVTFLFDAAEAMSAESPLIDGEGVQIVNAQCGACHSLALVAQNRADRAGWRALIRWMQDEHGLWPLGELRRLFWITLRPIMRPPGLADGAHSRQR